MIVCPNCQHKELPGSLFCSECGAQFRIPTEQLTDQVPGAPERPAPPTFSEAAVSLYVMDAGQILPLAGRDEFTVGRAAEGQPILPDVDLTPFRAYESGVSRLHISIKLSQQGLLITDLGSVNGTRLNGQKLPPNKPHLVNHGDILTLGKLKLQILIRR
jgi:hypothetical protein